MMTLTRSSKLVAPLGLALLAGFFTANLANAQEACRGKFTLPFEAQWGQVVLPAGEYSFTLDNDTVGGKVTIQSETGRTAGYVLNQGIYDRQNLDHSELILVRSGGSYTVRALRLEDLGMTLEYSVPKSEGQFISQGPHLLERIPVTIGG
jgi:hypothetical protein